MESKIRMQIKGTGKVIFCECPRCEAKLKMFITIYTQDKEVIPCPECKKVFNLSEALNLTVVTK